jgi:methylated-DNA-[protein]-cysteine S-methyltransferase
VADGVTACQLPGRSAQETLARLRRDHPHLAQAQPSPAIARVVERLQALLAGSPEGLADSLLDVELDMSGVQDFHRRVYSVTRAIPPGRTMTYGEVARAIGEPNASRAVGQALGHNPFAPIVPCHRVLGAGNSGTGFSATGGVATKLKMLETERAQLGGQPGLF